MTKHDFFSICLRYEQRQTGQQSGNPSVGVIASTGLSTVVATTQTDTEVLEGLDDGIESYSTRSEIDLTAESHLTESDSMSNRDSSEIPQPSRSLCDINLVSEAGSHNRDHQKSLNDLDKICETRRKQISGIQSDQKRPVTTANTPDPTPSNSSIDIQTYKKSLPIACVEGKEAGDDLTADVNGGLTDLNLAKTILTDDDSDSETEDSEQKRLLEDAVISVTQEKALFRK